MESRRHHSYSHDQMINCQLKALMFACDHEVCASLIFAWCECCQSTGWCFWFSTSPGRHRVRTTRHRTHRNFFKVKIPLTGLEPVLSALRVRVPPPFPAT